MKLIILILPLLASLLSSSATWARDNTPIWLQAAKDLTLQIDRRAVIFFDQTDLRLVPHSGAPLARFIPRDKGKDLIEIGSDTEKYRDDFIRMTSVIARPFRPDFDQYMTIQTALSLANERAHFEQRRNGSLQDLIRYRNSRNHFCTLYAEQQFGSDLFMLQTALSFDEFFQERNMAQLSQALQASLEQMNLYEVFLDYRIARLQKNHALYTRTLSSMKEIRHRDNLKARPECREYKPVLLDEKIRSRALITDQKLQNSRQLLNP